MGDRHPPAAPAPAASHARRVPLSARPALAPAARRAALTVVAALGLVLGGCAAPGGSRPGNTRASGVDAAAIDASVRAQDDFYDHANGGWLRAAPFPADKAYIGVANDVVDRTRLQLRQIAETAAAAPTDADTAKVGRLYASFMDEATVEKLGLQPLAAELARIDAVGDRRELAASLARLSALGANMPIQLLVGQDDRDATRYTAGLWQGGIALPNRDYYLKLDDPRFAAAREADRAYVARLLGLAGDAAATPAANEVLALEAAIARIQWSAVELRDPVKAYNKVGFAQLPTLAPGIDWPGWLAAAHLDARANDLLVGQPSYLTALAKLVETAPLPTWKAYAKAHLLDAYASYLPKAYVDARFAFVGTALSGTQQNLPRWERGIRVVDASLGDALARPYVAAYFPPASKARMEELVANLLAACRESIEAADWMGPATRAQALAKLATFNTKIGYPKRFIDYTALDIRPGDLVGDVMRARQFERDRQLAKLGGPVDRDEWGMSAQTVNAYYNASMNEIVFPAAILQAPYFDPAADDAANYGAIGATIGHEISHGFDDEGSQYDASGNLRDWWTPEDRARYEAKTAVLVRQYAAFVAVPPDHRVNGELTLGENIADNAGLALAWTAWQRSLGGKPARVIDGRSGAERFFLAYAQSWRSKEREDALLAQIRSDPHAPDRFRVLGAVRNQPGFYATFGVRPGDPMYLAPAERVSIW